MASKLDKNKVAEWTTAEVGLWLSEVDFADLVTLFRENDIKGKSLLKLNKDDLRSMGLVSMGKILELLDEIDSIRSAKTTKASTPSSPSIGVPSVEDATINNSLDKLTTQTTSDKVASVLLVADDYAQKLKTVVDAALSGLQAATGIAEHVPMFGVVFAAAGTLVDVLQATQVVKANCAVLAERVVAIIRTLDALVRIVDPKAVDAQLINHVERLSKLLTDATTFLSKFSSKGYLRRLIRSGSDATKFEDLDSGLCRVQQDLIAALGAENLKQTIQGNAAIQQEISKLSQISEHRTFMNTTAVVTEEIRRLGGADALMGNSKQLQQFANFTGIKLDELQGEMQEALHDIKLQLEYIQAELDNGIHRLIKQPPLRSMWKLCFTGSSQEVNLNVFIQSIRDYLRDKEGDDSFFTMQSQNIVSELLCANRKTISILTVAQVFGPPPKNSVRELIEDVTRKGVEGTNRDNQLRAIPTLRVPLIGRDDIVASVMATLKSHQLVWLHGVTGIGKSAIAQSVARRTIDSSTVSNVFYVNVQGVLPQNAGFSILNVADPQHANNTTADLLAWVSQTNVRCLVVIDNLNSVGLNNESMEWLRDVMSSNSHGLITLLITSTSSVPDTLSSPSVAAIVIPALSSDAATQLLLSLNPQATTEQQSEAAISCNPSSIISKTTSTRLQLRHLMTSSRALNKELSGARAMIVFSDGPFDEEAALAVLGSQQISKESANESTHVLLRSLIASGIITQQGTWLQLAPNIMDDTIADEAAELRYLQYYIYQLGQAVIFYESGNFSSGLTIIDGARVHFDRILFEIDLPPSILLDLFDALILGGDCLFTRWTAKQTSAFYDRVQAAVETEAGKQLVDHDLILCWAYADSQPDLAIELINNLESGIDKSGDNRAKLATIWVWDRKCVKLMKAACFKEAMLFAEKTLPVRIKLFGENHTETAKSFDRIGDAHDDISKYDLALDYYNKALDIRKSKLGDNHVSTAKSHNNIGNVYRRKGDYDLALEHYQKSLAIKQVVLGEKHTDTAASYCNIGTVYRRKGDYDLALEYYQKDLAITRSVLGEKHTDTASSYMGIGNVYQSKGDYDLALKYHKKSLAIKQAVLGQKNTDTAASYNNIGNLYEDKGDYDLALENYKKALSIQISIFDEDNPDVATSLYNLAHLHQNMNNLSSARECAQKAFDIYLRQLGPDNEDTKDAESLLQSLASTN